MPTYPGDAGDVGSIPSLGGSPRVGKSNPLQYSCLDLAGYNPWGCRVGHDWTTELVHKQWNRKHWVDRLLVYLPNAWHLGPSHLFHFFYTGESYCTFYIVLSHSLTILYVMFSYFQPSSPLVLFHPASFSRRIYKHKLFSTAVIPSQHLYILFCPPLSFQNISKELFILISPFLHTPHITELINDFWAYHILKQPVWLLLMPFHVTYSRFRFLILTFFLEKMLILLNRFELLEIVLPLLFKKQLLLDSLLIRGFLPLHFASSSFTKHLSEGNYHYFV